MMMICRTFISQTSNSSSSGSRPSTLPCGTPKSTFFSFYQSWPCGCGFCPHAFRISSYVLKLSKSVHDICIVSEYAQTHKPHKRSLSANADIRINRIQKVPLQPGVLHRSLTNNASIGFDINFYEKSHSETSTANFFLRNSE